MKIVVKVDVVRQVVMVINHLDISHHGMLEEYPRCPLLGNFLGKFLWIETIRDLLDPKIKK